MKRFASIWLPRFRIDRLRRDKPGLVPSDRPFALVESGTNGIIIVAVNARASEEGIRPGQALADARAIRPDLATLPADPVRDGAVLERFALWLGRYGPCRNAEGSDGLWVDITGVAHLFGGERALARDCGERLGAAGFAAQVAIADTRAGAFALARYGVHQGVGADEGAIAPRGGMRDVLAGLPVEALQLSGDLVLTLRRLGLRRIGQLYDLPRASLERRFRGEENGRRLPAKKNAKRESRRHARWAEALVLRLDQTLGNASEPAAGLTEPALSRVQKCYAEPLVSHAGILAALEELAIVLCAELGARLTGARRIRFVIFRSDGDIAQCEVRTSRPVASAGHIVDLFRLRLERIDAGLGIDALLLEAFDCEALVLSQTGWVEGRDAASGRGSGRGGCRAEMAVLGDRLANRLGPRAVYRLSGRDRHIPEYAQRCVPVLGEARPLPAVASPAALRPLFLLDPAERVDVLAEVPDGPPARFTWRRVPRRVVKAEGPERIAPEWWLRLGGDGLRAEAARRENGHGAGGDTTAAVPAPRWRTRDYWRVEDGEGAQYWLYRAGLYGDDPGAGDGAGCNCGAACGGEPPVWFLQGVF
jgi:protein ImuB